MLLLSSLLLTLVQPALPAPAPHLAQDDERRAPDPSAKPHTPYAWTSEGGLRYKWALPEGYDPSEPRHLTVICHGTGLDYRWGFWNNKPGTFRPNDVIVSVDGPEPAANKTRLFLGNSDNAAAIRDFLEEMRTVFAIDRVFLYGHSQGGFFVVYFAGEYPDEVDGVVAHASGAWNWSKMGRDVKDVAIAFMHGTWDPVVPYRQSPGSRDAYADKGFDKLHLRRLDRYNHWPNAVRANECLAWCQGMTSDDPEEVLALATEILRPKGADEYKWETVVGFAAAWDLIVRLVGEGKHPFDDVDADVLAKAKKLAAAVDDHAQDHVKALTKELGGKKGLKLDGKKKVDWLGHLVPLREDFRGVPAVEDFADSLGYDKLLKTHAKAAGKVFDAWYTDGAEPAEIFDAVIAGLSKSFLYEGYPTKLRERMKEWEDDADEHDLSKSSKKKYGVFERWDEGWANGRKEYKALWKKWKLPKL